MIVRFMALRIPVLVALALVPAITACSARKAFPAGPPRIEMDHVPRLGEQLTITVPSRHHTMASSAQTWPSYDVVAGGVTYTIGVDDSARVRFLATTDRAFRPPEGLKIGDSLEQVRPVVKDESIRLERGWGHFIALPSGWFAFIDDSGLEDGDLNLGTRPPGESAKVTMFFQRD